MRRLLLLLSLLAAIPAAEGRWVEAVLTAYSPLDDYTRDDEHNPLRLTATGVRTGEVPYGVAADPRALPFGSLVYIPRGLGYLDQSRPTDRTFAVDDTGSILKRRTRSTGILHLDLRYRSVVSAIQFGTQRALVYIVSP